ncbi:MAG: hypothetical protein PV358_13840, partial [Acidimicrobiales bacterium]|nr:hypothetical protein [Acidimicrobiales bacterium]
LPRAGRPTGAALAALLREVQRVVDAGSVVARAVAVLAAELERGEHPEHVSGMTRAHAGPPEPVGELSVVAGDAPDVRQLRQPRLARRIRVDVHALPGSLTEVAVAARRSAPCEVEVRLDGGAERRYGLWARAFDADDDTLVGIAPFVRDSSVAADAVARVLVPPAAGGHSRRRIEVDVTDRPEMPRPSPALSLVERARYQGTRAARAERLGDRVQARYRWSRCARLWEAAGDQRRAAQAGARAVAAPAVAAPAVGPLVCDLVYGC